MADETPGHDRVLWALLSGLAALVMVGGGAWLTSLHGQVSAMQVDINGAQRNLSSVTSRVDSTDSRLTRIEEYLIRQDGKLDLLLRRR